MGEINVILVNDQDEVIGYKEKLKAHKDGDLHRAFSVMVFNSQKQLLLQKRAKDKYHSGGLWTNTCCSHPSPDEENMVVSAQQRLQEEMGFSCDLELLYHFIYRTEFNNGLVEYELDHVLWGTYDKEPKPNPSEAETYEWVTWDKLIARIADQPETFTSWFKIIVGKIEEDTVLKRRIFG
ncbi:isopentenyl-diphosphate Delta-isomerase [Limibacter armeniacum]|uniref:isopentenyl-diphosphate Delta-isomerase n=1 Tax=Limibacter armeniacum TaxID=466084 RepID=UPI002FE571EA